MTSSSHDPRRRWPSIHVCWLNRHTVDRHAVNWDGENYVGDCTKCGKPIRRERRGVWKLDTQDRRKPA